MRVASLALSLQAVAAFGCGAASRSAAPSTAAILQVDCQVADAMVWIDDQAIGEVSEMPRGMRVRPGPHRVEVRHDRYHTRYYLVTLQQGEAHTLHVMMAALLD